MLRNSLLLLIFQLTQYAVPLVTLPYLARGLGVHEFGVLALAIALTNYGLLLTDWGFNLTGVQQTASRRGDPGSLRHMFWQIAYARLGLCFLSIVAACLAAQAVAGWHLAAVTLILSLQLVPHAVTPNWLVQGLEHMGDFTFANFCGRILTVPLTIALVNEPQDIGFAVFIQVVASTIIAGLMIRSANRSVALWPPARVDRAEIRNQVRRGWDVFLSQATIPLYAQTTMVVLGALHGPAMAAAFNGPDRIRRAAQTLTWPISAAAHPRISALLPVDKAAGLRLIVRLGLLQAALAAILSIVMVLAAEPIVRIVLGESFAASAPILQVLAALPFLGCLTNVLGVQTLQPLGMARQYSRVVLGSVVLTFLAFVPLCLWLGAWGTAAAMVLTELVVAAGLAIVVMRSPEVSRV